MFWVLLDLDGWMDGWMDGWLGFGAGPGREVAPSLGAALSKAWYVAASRWFPKLRAFLAR